MRLLALLIFSTFLNSFAFAADETPSTSTTASAPVSTETASLYHVELDEKLSRLQFGLFGQISEFSGANGALQGETLEAVLDYALRDHLAAQFSLSQAISATGGVSVLYTGLRAGLGYALMGGFIHRDSTLNIDGKHVVDVPEMAQPSVIADFGVDQILFNGTSRIVPATGGSLGIRYDTNFWHLRASAMLRYGQLLISDKQATMITAGVGLFLHF